MESNVNKWNNFYKELNKPYLYSEHPTSYKAGSEFLEDCEIVEDWGTGGGGFKLFRKNAIGVDGSNTPFADKKFIDLTIYTSICDGIFIRHILEHNYEWEKILHNALKSARKKICIVMFIPLINEKTKQVVFRLNIEPVGVPDLAIGKEEFFSIVNQYPVTYKSVLNGSEEIIYIEKIDKNEN